MYVLYRRFADDYIGAGSNEKIWHINGRYNSYEEFENNFRVGGVLVWKLPMKYFKNYVHTGCKGAKIYFKLVWR